MSVASAAERTLLDTHPQRSKLYLSVFQPQTALSCQVNGSYNTTNQTVGYDNVTAGSYLNIHNYDFQVALIGTTPGDDDIGRTWVRSATSSTLRFLESSHINWADNLYVTVLKYTEIIPVFPHIIQDPADEENVIFYKIWDVAYTNQNSILGTFINMGSNYAGFLEAGTGTAYWSASGTTNVIGNTVTYSWSFEGATVTGSTAHTPGNISWNQPGHYRVILDTTSSAGRVDRSIRYVSWYNRPGEGNSPPILNFEMSEFGGSREGVGYTGRIKVRGNITESTILPGALIVIFKEDWYGNTKQSINKNALGRGSIFFTGYVNGETINYNYTDNWVEFEVVSPTNLMELTECFGVSCESKTAPTTWYEVLNMTIARALYHYYAWHSSVLMCCDFSIDFTGDRNIQFFDADRTSLYDAGNSVVDSAVRSRMISDSLGHIWVDRDVSVKQNAAAYYPVALHLSSDEMLETPSIDVRTYEEVSFIELGGISYDPATNTSVPLLASAPGTAPAYHGNVERKQGLALASQAELNIIVGNLYAYFNSKYPNVRLKLRGNFANLDIAPQELVSLTIDASSNPRGVSWSEKKFAIKDVSWAYYAAEELLIPTITLAEVTQGFNGTTIVIPIEPPDEGSGGGSFTPGIPPIHIPPIPVVPPVTMQIAVYHNGVLVGMATGLNFVDG